MNLTVLYCLSWLIGIFFAEVYLSDICKNCVNGQVEMAGCLNGYGSCNACINGFYGDLCTEPCSSACNGCFQNNGSCIFCKQNFYGVTCEKPCSDKCDNQECEMEGHCFGCADPHFYGNECDIACSSNITNCEECTALDENILCLNCSGAKFGKQCENECPESCELCSATHCTKCALGFSGSKCDCTIPKCLECDVNGYCEMCEPGLFGQQCAKLCPDCKTCKAVVPKESTDIILCLSCYEGTFLNDTVCLPCPNNCSKCSSRTECLLCLPGYYGKDCAAMCPVNCLPDPTGQYVCDEKDGTCSGDCRDGFYGDYCNLTCIGNCGSSSGRQGCNKWSGECFTCSDGYYGQFCNLTCGANCGPASGRDMCERDTGNCASCEPKFYGSKCENHCSTACENFCDQETGKCDVCISNRYGDYCTRKCPEYCGPAKSTKVVCHKQNAECRYCKIGSYGERCIHYCDNNCARSNNIPSCEKTDGRCKGCINGFYGNTCDSTCEHCKDNICDQNTGHCKSGCKTGWFNLTCTERCSSTCKGEECDRLTGVCLAGCVEGYGGQFCNSGTQDQGSVTLYGLAGVAAAVVLLIVSLALTLVILYKRKSKRRERPFDHGTVVSSMQEPMTNIQRHFTEEETQPTVSCRQAMPQNIPLKQEAMPAISKKQVSRHTDQNASTDQQSLHQLHQKKGAGQTASSEQVEQHNIAIEQETNQNNKICDQEYTTEQRQGNIAIKRKEQKKNLNEQDITKVISSKQTSRRYISNEKVQAISSNQMPCKAEPRPAFISKQKSKRAAPTEHASDSGISSAQGISGPIHGNTPGAKRAKTNIQANQRANLNKTDDERSDHTFVIAF